MTFRFKAKYGLLTYAQCGNLDPFKIVTRLSELGAECIVGREKHQDGNTHLHVFFHFEKEFSSRSERVFDVDGHHPNIVRSRGTPGKGWDYATKEGDICAGGLERPSDSEKAGAENKWAYIVAAQTESEFWERVEECDPRAMACNYGNLAKYCDWKYRPVLAAYEHPQGISFITEQTADINRWATENVRRNTDGKYIFMPTPALPPGVIFHL